MRIVAGAFGGRKLLSPKNEKIRPTIDRVREAIFSMIASQIEEAQVLDLFAGTGALGLEALSRGAARAVLVDQSLEAVRLIAANVERCGVQDRVTILRGSVPQVIDRLREAHEAFELIFMDPPYGRGLVEKTLVLLGAVAHSEALVVAEHHVRDVVPERWGGWLRTQQRRYGDTAISFFVKDQDLPG